MRGKKLYLFNKRFGRLLVIRKADKRGKDDSILWQCKCDCGSVCLVYAGHLRSGHTKSCGCLKKDIFTTHNGSYLPEYQIWYDMIQRCTNNKNINYNDYGRRGITVCDRWLDFLKFFSDMGSRPSNSLTLNRINNNGNYEPSNCEWTTMLTQARNKRVYKNNISGVNGVSWDKSRSKYQSRIKVNGESVYLGRFDCLEDAKEARRQGEIKYWGAERNEA